MTTQYAARHVALGGDDSEPEGLASAWGDGPAPRRAFEVAEEIPATFDAYVPAPGQTPGWHIAVEPSTPLAPGPVHAATPVTVGPLTDPASFPTPVSNFAAVSYQSMPSPMPYASAPAQGTYAALTASPYAAPVPSPYGAPGAAWSPENLAVGATAVKVAVTVQRVISLIVVAVVLATFTAAGLTIGGQAWWIVGFAWGVGLIMLAGILMPGRMRLRRSALK